MSVRSPEPIAVVGLGCRFPGGVRTLEALGELLESGADALTEVPRDRWGAAIHDPRRERPGTVVSHVGGFLDDIDRFDAAYFGISPREAGRVDPQQRLLLEVSAEAMADAGRPLGQWRGSRTAVFVGMLSNDYTLLHAKTLGTAGIGQHYASGVEASFAAGRLAYSFDLRGPVATVSSACSSSLLAVHQACQSLRAGESDTALAGGVNLQITPDISVFMSQVGAISPNGRCRPFDARADGLVRGDGCGIVVLKRLRDALADHDRIHAVLRGSAVNNDGGSAGLTAPNGEAQSAVLRAALAAADTAAADVDYVEAHGTGTPLGDLIELEALSEVYGAGRRDRALLIGSLKAVMGHMDAAAGIGGLLKALWVIHAGRVPAQPHIESLNPALDWATAGVAVPLTTTDVARADVPVRVGVSAFGLSGTNVHLVAEGAPAPAPAPVVVPVAPQPPAPYVLLASASTPEGLATQVDLLREQVAREDDIGELAASAATRRTHDAHRFAAVATGRRDLVDTLVDPDDPPRDACAATVEDPDDPPPAVFVYSGQSGHWPHMALDLHAADPTVRDTLDECHELIRAHAGWSLLDTLRATDDRLDRTDRAHPAIFAVQVALTRWLAERGLTPAAVIGQSLGEITAAYAAGSLTLPDATRLVVERADILHSRAAGLGFMYAVSAGADEVRELLGGAWPQVVVALVNGPDSAVISGPVPDLDAAVAALRAAGLRCKRLNSEYPAHSPALSGCADELYETLSGGAGGSGGLGGPGGSAGSGLSVSEPTTRLLSTVDPAADLRRPDAAYWRRNLVEPVQLWPAVERLLRERDYALVEIAPHPMLVRPLTDAVRRTGRRAPVTGTLHRAERGPVALHKTLARLHVAGVPVDWDRVTGRPRQFRTLPVPTWGGDRHWLPGIERGHHGSSLEPVPDGAVPLNEPAPAPTAPISPTAPITPTAPSDQSVTIADRVAEVIRAVLDLPPDQRLLRRRGLFEQGLDSLTAAELRTRLQAQFGVALPVPIVFEHPTVQDLAAYLETEAVAAPTDTDAAASATDDAATAEAVRAGEPVPGLARDDAATAEAARAAEPVAESDPVGPATAARTDAPTAEAAPTAGGVTRSGAEAQPEAETAERVVAAKLAPGSAPADAATAKAAVTSEAVRAAEPARGSASADAATTKAPATSEAAGAAEPAQGSASADVATTAGMDAQVAESALTARTTTEPARTAEPTPSSAPAAATAARIDAPAAESAPTAQAAVAQPRPEAVATAESAPAAEPAAESDPNAAPADNAIAVIGIACRLPGAGTPEAYWDLLAHGRHAIGNLPARRREDPVWDEVGGDLPTRGGYLDDIAGFDAPFFRISPREAKSLDPQQRLFLEVAWEALEDGGCRPRDLEGSRVGVYVGLETADYQQMLTRDMADVNLYYGTGTSFAATPGRLSYFLGLRGPSMAVDTACSASLTAVHLACQGLLGGDCEVAVVGGANVIAAPTVLVAMNGEGGALAPDGHCKAFDDDADGLGWGEGAAALVLKPLAAAERDGDRVYSVLRASAINQDGASGGLTVPSGAAQVAVVREALDRAGWQPHEVDYVEAHGTGTRIGDPIEVRSLAEAFGPGRGESDPLLIGSVKANIGHLAPAAGIAGLLKVVLALHHGSIPPHRLNRLTTRVDWDAMPLAVPTAPRDWPARQRPARAGVSSFGLAGSNAHVLVEAAPPTPNAPADTGSDSGAPYVLPVTAATASALPEAARRMARRLRGLDAEAVDALVFTAAHRRSLLEHRLAVVGDRDEMAAALEAAAAGRTAPNLRTGHVTGETARSVTFWYAGRAPVASVCAALEKQPAYARALDRASEAVGERGLLAHHMAATHLWSTFGVVPHSGAGEGAGEISADWANGRLTPADAARAWAERGADLHAAPAAIPPGALPVHPEMPDPDTAETPDPVRQMALAAAELYVSGYEPPAHLPARGRTVSLPVYPWERRSYWYRDAAALTPCVLSAASAEELRHKARKLSEFVLAETGASGPGASEPGASVAGVGSALAALPPAPHRAVLFADRREELLKGLAAVAGGRETRRTVVGSTRSAATDPVFVFPGQGSQWRDMARELLESSPVFAESVAACAEVIEPLTGWSVVEVLGREEEGWLERIDVLQPVMFAVQVSLARLWQACGVRPAAVIGHSQGEVAAACVSGALSLEDAARVMVLRSRILAKELAGKGAMASVGLAAAQVRRRIAELGFDDGDAVVVAGFNGPSSTVISGERAAVEQLVAACVADGLQARVVPVTYASHSPQVERLQGTLLDALDGIQGGRAETPFYSTVTGEALDTRELTAAYWYRNARQPVNFEGGIRSLLAAGHETFIEISTHPVVLPGIEQTVDEVGSPAVALGTLRRKDGSLFRFRTALAQAWVRGVSVDWRALTPAPATEVDLPDLAAAPAGAQADPADAEFWDLVERADAGELADTLRLDGEAAQALAAALPALSAWRRERHADTLLDTWRYTVEWQPLPTPPASQLGGPWLLVVPSACVEHPWVTRCAEALGAHGADVRQVVLDAADAHREAFAKQLRAATEETEPTAVLSLLALDEQAHRRHKELTAGAAAAVTLLQALDDLASDAPVWWATTRAVSVGESDPPAHPRQAHVLGTSRVALLENPRRTGGQIDLPEEADDTAGRLLAAALATDGDESEFAVRGDQLHRRRLVRAPLAGRAPVRRWRPRGTALVTGGTGGIGAQVARWLAHNGAEHLLLLSRSGPTAPGAADLEAELTASGVQVTIAACDVADPAELAAVLAAVPAAHPVTSVFHTAGLKGSRDTVAVAELAEYADVFAAKVEGARNLRTLLDGPSLDAFVLFSSTVGVWGGGQQGAYVAANAYLNALAEELRAEGTPATAVAWSAWDGPGMSSGAAEHLAERGVRLMDPGLAMRALRQVLDHDDTFITVADNDWERFAEVFGAARRRPLIGDLPEVRRVWEPEAADDSTAEAALVRRLAGLTPAQRENALLEEVCAQVAAVLQYPATQSVDAEQPFKGIGFDSLTGIELRNRLNTATGLRLPATLIFDHPTPAAVAAFLDTRLAPEPADTPQPPDGTPPPRDRDEAAAIAEMTLDDLIQLTHRPQERS
ncbi:type I polyketide synthase [Streptomyces sp. NPDC055099]